MYKVLTALVLTGTLALGASGTTFTVNEPERGLFNMHPELVVEDAR